MANSPSADASRAGESLPSGGVGPGSPEGRPDRRLADAYSLCRRMQRHHDPTFYLATLRLPRTVRPAVHAVYGFVRSADEVVDGNGSDMGPEQKRAELDRLGSDLAAALEGDTQVDPTALALADSGRRHHLPLGHLDRYLDSMRRDIGALQITDWEDLESYMQGSAGSVGWIMAPLLGAPPRAHSSFARLGLAFQLTNFIRDLREDTALGRVYLPADELERAGVDPGELSAPSASPALRAVIATQVERARGLFAEGDLGSESVSPRVRRGVRLARAVYERTLDRIESLGHDVLGNRASLPPLPLASAVAAGLRTTT